MKIPIAKPYLDQDDAQQAFDTVLSGWVTQGPQVEAFEQAFAKAVNSQHAVAVSSCTAALHLSMVVSEIGLVDEVICPSMSYIATANSIKHVGATPVFAEVGEDFNLDIEDVRTKITPKTKAILLVHQLGMPADLQAFRSLCREHDLLLIEDAACAIGSTYQGQQIGHTGLVCFSFHPRKVITTGDGGMICTDDKLLADRLRRLRQHGMDRSAIQRHHNNLISNPDHLEVGYNYRMTDIQAAIGLSQLQKLQTILNKRHQLADRYHNALGQCTTIRLPLEEPRRWSNYQSYCITLQDRISRDDLASAMLDKGISTRPGVMCAHRQTAYQNHQIVLPRSESLEDRSLIIPLFAQMTHAEQDFVIDSIVQHTM